jgi:CheY-like chemotaxis protein
LLAGRKLLLADDSITIQKVVDLTFADEGVKVFSVGNGREAIEKLEEFAPDVVLADVFMPELSGYQVCEHIKRNEKLKHIPVMLLVGSFEPFDEAEARRVGADDILTKPFQSIRKLIDKVGGLMGGGGHSQAGSSQPLEAPTAELPTNEAFRSAPERLSSDELEMTTADTRQLPGDLKSFAAATSASASERNFGQNMFTDTQKMETSLTSPEQSIPAEPGDALLDLGDIALAQDDAIGEEFVLDLDMNDLDEPEPAATMTYSSSRAFVEPKISEPQSERGWASVGEGRLSGSVATESRSADQLAKTQEFARPSYDSDTMPQRVTDEPETGDVYSSAPSGKITLDQLSPEVIDAIAKRAVAMLSEKVVQEIAWEVVPELSELLIKRQLEEKKP